MNLRTRLTLAFLLVASLLAVVGFVAARADREAQYYVSQLERSSVLEVHHASAMALALQRAKTAAEELVTERYRLRLAPSRSQADERSPEDIEAELWQGLAAFEQHLEQSRAATQMGIQLALEAGDVAGGAAEHAELNQGVDPIAASYASLKVQVGEFLRLAAADTPAAHRHLNETLGPQFRNQLLPLVYRYRDNAVEELSTEVEQISAAAGAAANALLVTSVGAVALALLLGFTVARSIARPVMALGQAAERLGRGDLTSRVEVPGTGELGVLAEVFNRMAEDLSATTVSRTYLRNVIESMAGALIITDSTARIVSVNRAALELLGYDAEEELAGQPVSRIYASTGGELGDDTAFGRLARTLGTTRGVEEQFVRRDGSQVSVAFSGAALRDERGGVQGFVCVAHDITERKKVEGRLRTFLREKELLLREVHHRVRNNLQVVSSLLNLQSGSLQDPPARQAFEESQHRIRAMALIHEQLYQANDLAHIDFRAYIEKLASHLLESYAVHPERVDLRLEVMDLPLDIDQAVPCGLIVNELVANALKHAFPEGENGLVRIAFDGTPTGGYRLLVADNGRGLEKDFDVRTSEGLGLSLVSTLVQQLNGRMQLKSNGGTECRIEFSPRRQELPVPA